MATILIVEDDPAIARLLDLALSVEGYTTEVALSGSEAVERLRGPSTDLVLLDVMLPDVDGIRVLRALRSSEGWEATRVVLVTALDSDDEVWRGWANGTDYYLTKPFDLSHLRAVAERLLAGEDLSGDRRSA